MLVHWESYLQGFQTPATEPARADSDNRDRGPEQPLRSPSWRAASERPLMPPKLALATGNLNPECQRRLFSATFKFTIPNLCPRRPQENLKHDGPRDAPSLRLSMAD